MSNTSAFSDLAPKDWKEVINKMLQNNDVVVDTPTCIHKVPKRLRVIKPEAYTPHYMGLGPYHHWRDDLYAMEPYKLIASLKSQDQGYLNDKKQPQTIDSLGKHLTDEQIILQIRASYDRHLGVEDGPLALMMMIDGIFLLQFLQVFVPKSKSCLTGSSRTRRLVDDTESAYHSILQDIMMLENQIPIFVLERILSLELLNEPVDILPTMLWNTCTELSPFKPPKHHNNSILIRRKLTNYSHLLELLYYSIVPQKSVNDMTSRRCRDADRQELPSEEKEKLIADHIPHVPPPNLGAGDNINCIHNNKLFRVIHNMIKLVSDVIPCIPKLFSDIGREGEKSNDLENGGRSNPPCDENHKEAPKVDEIKIPSVKDLVSVGIEFCPIGENESIEYIKFNKKSRKFYLPSITINDNTEVIIRNLVAYEAVGIHGPLVLARYTELMNGIIDTAEDVQHLRERKIIVSYLKKDEDVAQLWNGMSRCIRLSYVHSIDKAIKDVNEFYDNKTRVKFIRFSKDCMLCAWKISMLLLSFLLLLLMAIQSFCEIYRCPSALQPVTKRGP